MIGPWKRGGAEEVCYLCDIPGEDVQYYVTSTSGFKRGICCQDIISAISKAAKAITGQKLLDCFMNYAPFETKMAMSYRAECGKLLEKVF